MNFCALVVFFWLGKTVEYFVQDPQNVFCDIADPFVVLHKKLSSLHTIKQKVNYCTQNFAIAHKKLVLHMKWFITQKIFLIE